jgi:molybdopterin-synthase adenylyltransferase
VLENKAKAIKKKLESFYPHANVKAVSTSVEEALEKGTINLNDYDAIIVATGNATLNQYLNRLLKKEIPATPVLYSWLDPFGIGCHCLITNIDTRGCFHCLYANEDLHNSASFADKLQSKSFAKNIAGCGTTYVPYGSLDAIQTAILTVRKLLDVFCGKETQSSVNSWKGDSSLFLSEGYNLSPRYNQSEEQLQAGKELFYEPNCPVCGKK